MTTTTKSTMKIMMHVSAILWLLLLTKSQQWMRCPSSMLPRKHSPVARVYQDVCTVGWMAGWLTLAACMVHLPRCIISNSVTLSAFLRQRPFYRCLHTFKTDCLYINQDGRETQNLLKLKARHGWKRKARLLAVCVEVATATACN